MAGHRDGDMRHLAVANPGIPRKGHNAFLVGGHDTCHYLEIIPHILSLALPFGHQYLAVRLGHYHDHGRLLSGRDSRAFRQADLDGRDGSLVQVNLPSQLDLQGRAPTQRKQGGHREAGRPACAHGIWNVDFDKKPNQSTATQGSVVMPVRTQHHSAIPFGEEFLSLAAFTSEASHSVSSAGRFASTAKPYRGGTAHSAA